MAKIFGIDLGTTYSCIAYVDEYGKPTTVTNSDNSPVTPSVVFFETPDSYSVGRSAKEALNSDPELVCSAIKRQMGTRDFTFNAHGKEYQPETVSALILKKVAGDAEAKLGEPVKDVVITCPAYFGLDARKATEEAGRIAGLNVLGVIPEPTAAAISYGVKVDEPQTIMVYDLGGGTFDVTIIKVAQGVIDVVATGGDHHLGGKDWDAVITNHVIDRYCSQTGATSDSIFENALILGDLELESEKAKMQLSDRAKAVLRFEGERIEMTKDEFETMTAGLLQSTVDKTRETLAEAAKKGVNKIDKILLVGGSTKMPQVRARLETEFPGITIEAHEPDESVAKGAAIYGLNMEIYNRKRDGQSTGDLPPVRGLGDGGKLEVRNVISKSIGLRFQDDDGSTHIFNQIFANTTVPCDYSIDASTVSDNQQKVFIEVFENDYKQGQTERDIVPDADNTPLVSDYIQPLPSGLPKGSPILIVIKIDALGFMTIDATDKTGGRTVHMEVQLQNMLSEEQLQEAIGQVSSMKLSN